MTAKERFLAKVNIVSPTLDSCWEWTGAYFLTGYPAFWINGKTAHGNRVSYTLFVGPIPEGMVVRHKCDNSKCVRPSHLETGTIRDNLLDRSKRGRLVRAALTPNDVRIVRELSTAGYTQRELASQFGVAKGTIQKVVQGTSYAWVA
jgi:hypothetical protein